MDTSWLCTDDNPFRLSVTKMELSVQVGDGRNWSLPFQFTTLQAVSPQFQPYRIGVVADLGITDNSTVTFDHLTESLPDVVSS